MQTENYFCSLQKILDNVLHGQLNSIRQAADIFAEAIKQKHRIYAFGTNHAGLIALEMFYRTGGLVTVNPIRAPGLMLEAVPVTLTTDLERMPDYGRSLINRCGLRKNDVLFIHSVSGRNAVSIDAALHARELGAYVIALTNMKTTQKVASRHASGKNLYEVSDLVIDNCGSFGDAELSIQGLAEKFAPTSTVIGAAIVNAVVAETIDSLLKQDIVPPVFISSNVAGGDEHNQRVLDIYQDSITYL